LSAAWPWLCRLGIRALAFSATVAALLIFHFLGPFYRYKPLEESSYRSPLCFPLWYGIHNCWSPRRTTLCSVSGWPVHLRSRDVDGHQGQRGRWPVRSKNIGAIYEELAGLGRLIWCYGSVARSRYGVWLRASVWSCLPPSDHCVPHAHAHHAYDVPCRKDAAPEGFRYGSYKG